MKLHNDIYKRIVSAKLFIDEKYYEPIDLDQLAKRAFLSRFYFHRLFTHIYKVTPHQYLTKKRMDAAKILLSGKNISITDICTHVGFESAGSFSSLFSKQNGQSPQYYRNLAWLKKNLVKEQPKKFIPHCFIEQYNLDVPC